MTGVGLSPRTRGQTGVSLALVGVLGSSSVVRQGAAEEEPMADDEQQEAAVPQDVEGDDVVDPTPDDGEEPHDGEEPDADGDRDEDDDPGPDDEDEPAGSRTLRRRLQVTPQTVQGQRNAEVLGRLVFHFGPRDITFVCDGFTAFRAMEVFRTGVAVLDDFLHPEFSSALDTWFAFHVGDPLAISWEPGVPSGRTGAAFAQHLLAVRWREVRQPTVAELGAKYGFSKQTFSKTLLGERWAGQRLETALLEALNLPPLERFFVP